MEKKLRLHPKAEEELNQSYDWHNQNRSDSGDDFLLSVNEKLEQIIENPESRSADSDGVRWASVAKFPYHIYYLFRTLIVWILAIWHNSRKTRRMERKSQRSELNQTYEIKKSGQNDRYVINIQLYSGNKKV